MKRCPQCLFLYPDSDEKCDFDLTPLESVDDSALESTRRPNKLIILAILAAAGLLLSALTVAVYFGLRQQARNVASATQGQVEPVADHSKPFPETIAQPGPPSPVFSPSPPPLATSSPSPTGTTTRISAHTRASPDPVSTSGPGIGTRQGGKPVITLTSGGKIDADEVWRTKDGVWYRRNGIVTLLKRGQVKSIVTR